MSDTSTKPAREMDPTALIGDLVPPGHPLFGIVWVNPERMSGTPCFAGTRVPVQALFDYLEGGDTIDAFLSDFDGVSREQAEAVITLAAKGLLERIPRG